MWDNLNNWDRIILECIASDAYLDQIEDLQQKNAMQRNTIIKTFFSN